MANLNHETVLSAAWILMRRAREAGSPYSQIADGAGNPVIRQNETARASESHQSIGRLISAYLSTPTHISTHFHSW
jgi:hypothetical protein